MLQLIRSVLYLMCMAFFTMTHGTLVVILFWAPANCLQFIIENWCRVNLFCLKILCGLSYEIKGMEHVDEALKQGGVVLMSKHQSTMETMIFQSELKQKPALVLKKELLKIPFYGWALAQIKPIAIDRTNKSSAMEQVVSRGTHALNEGRSVLIFPEGTRTPYGKAMVVKKGGINLALNAQAPIIPVALNTGKFWGRASLIKKPGKATLSFGLPIMVNKQSVDDLRKQIKSWIDQENEKFD